MKAFSRLIDTLKWIKSHRVGSFFSIAMGISIPIVDTFIDIWASMGKIRPMSGFPLWLIILSANLVVIALTSLLISKKIKKPIFLIKENVREWIKMSLMAMIMLLTGVLLSVLNTSVTNRNDKRMFYECLKLEKQYLIEGSHGLQEFYKGNYITAFDSLKLYCNSDPVSACYYAEIIFDGLCKGVEQYETTNAVRLLDSSANRQFYRAIFKMEDYYYRQNMKKEAMQYANQLLRVSSLCKPYKVSKEISKKDSISILQNKLWSGYCNVSHERLLDYCIINDCDRQDVHLINDFYYTYLSGAFDKKFLNIQHEIRNIQADWKLGYRKSAEKQARRLVGKYPGEPSPANLYANILLNEYKNISNVDSSSLKEAEMVLVEALKHTSQGDCTTPHSKINEMGMFRVASNLTRLYDSTGYWIEAAEMEHLATAYILMDKYRAYETTNK